MLESADKKKWRVLEENYVSSIKNQRTMAALVSRSAALRIAAPKGASVRISR